MQISSSLRGMWGRLLCGCVAAAMTVAVVTADSIAQQQPPIEVVNPSGKPDQFGGYASTHVIIQVKDGFVPVQLSDARWTLQPENQRDPAGVKGDAIAATTAKYGAVSIAPAFINRPKNQALAEKYGLNRYYKINVPRGTNTPALAAELQAFGDVIERAELDGVGGIAAEPTDPSFSLQWGMHNTGQNGGTPDADIDAPEAWDLHVGSSDILVAVLDTGAQDDHPDLIGRVTLGPPTYPCFPEPVPPYSPCTSTDSYDLHGHGTHCVGTIAANVNNAVGIAGLDWNCHILAIRVVNPISGSGTPVPVADGIIYATDNGADIISMSLQFYEPPSSAMQNAVAYAYDSGVLPIAATGNFQPAGTIAYPAKFPKCMAVGGTNKLDQKYSGSNTGPEIDVTAPGQDVYSLWKNSGYLSTSGTSMATPHVAGLASLIRSYNPALTLPEIEQILKDTAEDKGAAGFDVQFGWGRINAHAALVAATPEPACEGELTGDNTVNVDDLLLVINAWGACPAPPASCSADFVPAGGNGTVNVDDLLGVIMNWGACP